MADSTSAATVPAADVTPQAKAVLDYWQATRPLECDAVLQPSLLQINAIVFQHFAVDCEALLQKEYDTWQQQPLECLAGIIIGDQMFRNAVSGTPKMYAADNKVLSWAKELLASGADVQMSPIQRTFAYMPLMHSEVVADQQACVEQYQRLVAEFEASGWEEATKMMKSGLSFAESHRDTVARWGRFSHRNIVLGRPSTPEEVAGIAAGTIPKW